MTGGTAALYLTVGGASVTPCLQPTAHWRHRCLPLQLASGIAALYLKLTYIGHRHRTQLRPGLPLRLVQAFWAPWSRCLAIVKWRYVLGRDTAAFSPRIQFVLLALS